MSVIYRRGGKQRHKLKVTTREREITETDGDRQTDRERQGGRKVKPLIHLYTAT